MPEIFPHTLGGGLEIWASIFEFLSTDKDTHYDNSVTEQAPA